jgi:hypothetical protein
VGKKMSTFNEEIEKAAKIEPVRGINVIEWQQKAWEELIQIAERERLLEKACYALKEAMEKGGREAVVAARTVFERFLPSTAGNVTQAAIEVQGVAAKREIMRRVVWEMAVKIEQEEAKGVKEDEFIDIGSLSETFRGKDAPVLQPAPEELDSERGSHGGQSEPIPTDTAVSVQNLLNSHIELSLPPRHQDTGHREIAKNVDVMDGSGVRDMVSVISSIPGDIPCE